MGAISLKSLRIVQGTTLFSNLNLVIGDGDRVGLVAGNGNGKTTLLRMIAGLTDPTEGEITRSRGLKLGYVEQDVPERLMSLTLRDAVIDGLDPELRETDTWRADIALDDMQAPEELRDRLVGSLSGGWQRLMLIARVWVGEPDALLMDEPTNHLDLSRIFELERWLGANTRNMPVLIASHDRAFLDAVTNRTLFLRPGTSRYFAQSYSAARAALEEMDAADGAQMERDLKEAGKLRKQAAKLTNIGINSGSDLLTVKAKQLKDRAARIEDAARPVHRERSGEIRLDNRETQAKVLLSFDKVEVTIPTGQLLFRIDKLHVFQGDRIVLLGRNGAGKTQLIKLMQRAIVQPGSVSGVWATPSLVLGYTDQDMSQLPDDETPEALLSSRYKETDARLRSLLAAAGFSMEMQGRRIGQMSPGQKSRLGLLALRLSKPNFYLMDEPTNHLDIPGRETLEDELTAPEATGVVVTHDRSFLAAVGSRFLEIRGKRLVEVEGPEAFLAALAADG